MIVSRTHEYMHIYTPQTCRLARYAGVLQYVAGCCSVVQCVHGIRTSRFYTVRIAVWCSMMQYDSVCCSVLQFVHDNEWLVFRHRTLQCAAVCCSTLQCVAVRCSVSMIFEWFVFRHYKRHLHARDLQKHPLETYKNDCQIARFENPNGSFVRVCHDSFICIHMHAVTHSYLWRESYVSVTWLVYMCSMTLPCVLRDLFNYASWLIRMRDMTRLYVCHDSFI